MTQAVQAAAPGTRRGKARAYLIAVVVFVFLVVLGAAGYHWASQGGLATLIEFQGSLERDSAGKFGQWIKAESGDEFYGGDGARTFESATATFRLLNGAKLSLKANSKVRFQNKAQKNAMGVTVEVGEADIQTTVGALIVDSEFGPIQIEANSKLALRRNGAQLGVEVELGSITLGETGRRLIAGETVDIEIGGVLIEPQVGDVASPQPSETDQELELQLDRGDGVSSSDLVVQAGDTFTVHDPAPPTRVGLDVAQLCRGKGARLTSGKQTTEAAAVTRLQFPAGRHEYEVRCLDDPGKVAKSGLIIIMSDAGTRNLPTFAPSANVSTDGRQYTVLYQHRLPQVIVTWPNAPQAGSYRLQIGSRTIATSTPNYTLSNLSRGTHQVTFSANSTPPRKSRTTTISVVYDTQAPAARVTIPPSGYAAGSTINVAGQALPGWTVSVKGKELEVDSQRRFSMKMTPDDSLPIAFSHPSLGTHYYLRRSKSSAP